MTGLKLLSRPGCHLCDEAAAILKRMGVRFATINVETDVRLEQQYGDLIPVLLHEEREIARAPLDQETLRRALRSLQLSALSSQPDSTDN